MGAVASILGFNQGRTDDPDPITGLTSRDKYLIKTSWEPVRKDCTKHGVTLLMMYFEEHPQDINYFSFKHIPMQQLPANKGFQAHCNSVLYAVSSIVDSLDDSELLVSILTKHAVNHKRRDIKSESFWNLKKTMLELFGKIMTKDAVAAWDKALEVSFKVIEQHL